MLNYGMILEMWTIMQKNNEATGEILDTENTQDISVSLKRQFA